MQLLGEPQLVDPGLARAAAAATRRRERRPRRRGRRGDQAACLTLPIAPSSRSRPGRDLVAAERLGHRLLGPLEEDVGDLDLVRPGRLADREGVDVALDPVAPVRSRGSWPPRRSVLKSTISGGPPGVLDQEVDRAAQDGAGDLEQDRHLGPRRSSPRPARRRASSRARRGPGRAGRAESPARRPAAQGEALDDLGRGLAPPVRLAPLEQRVGGGAPGGAAPRGSAPAAPRPEGSSLRSAAAARWPSSRGDRRVGERPVRRLRPGSGRAAAPGPRRGPASGSARRGRRATSSAARSGEARLTRTAICDGSKSASRPGARPRRRHGDVGVRVAVEVEARRRSARSPACPASPRRRLRLDDAAEDQPLAGPGGGDVEEAQLLLGVALLAPPRRARRRRRG